jgi:hypothetical protein
LGGPSDCFYARHRTRIASRAKSRGNHFIGLNIKRFIASSVKRPHLDAIWKSLLENQGFIKRDL